MALNSVEVRAIDPPAGEAPILWSLVPTEPIDTDGQVAAVITAYPRRWIIEAFFEVLKTGCRYEDLQRRSSHALLNALCLLLPGAWSLLHLRWLERAQPETAAPEVVTTTQIEVLVRHQQRRSPPLPSHPTVRQAPWSIASLGGHLTHNGAPGALTLLRAFRTLLRMEEAVLALREPEPAEM